MNDNNQNIGLGEPNAGNNQMNQTPTNEPTQNDVANTSQSFNPEPSISDNQMNQAPTNEPIQNDIANTNQSFNSEPTISDNQMNQTPTNEPIQNDIANTNQSFNPEPIVNNTQPVQSNTNINQSVNTPLTSFDNNTVNQVPNNNLNNQNGEKKKSKLPLIIGIAIVVLFLLSRCNNSGSNLKVDKNRTIDYDRVIMIYMVGSNLESGPVGAGTLDLEGIDYYTMESNKTKVIAITGGAKSWHNNYVDPNTTSIYELTSTGYKVVNNQSLKNMGNAKVLTDFLNYGYTNYAANKYDLLFWNHGLGVIGYGSDEISNDYLDLSEMRSAFNNTAFKGDNKLEVIIFRTCLNSTLEVADTLKNYSNYLVASEETTWMYNGDNVLKVFNSLRSTDNGNNVGMKYIDGYMNYIAYLNNRGTYTYNTYAVTDLSKVDKIEAALTDFVKDINLNANYSQIAKVRSAMYQYGSSDPSFDSIDLYNFVYNLKSLSPTKAQTLLNALSEAIVYNKATDSRSKGLSIYFPYNGDKNIKSTILRKFYKFDDLKDYKNFISSFNDIQNSNNTATSLSANAIDLVYNDKNKQADFKFTLTDEQAKTLDKASFLIYEKYTDDDYLPVYYSQDVHFTDNTLEQNVRGRQLKLVDKLNDGNTLAEYKFHEDDNTKAELEYLKEQQIILIEEEETDDYILYYALVLLSNQGLQNMDKDLAIDQGKMYLKLDKKTNKITIDKVLVGSEIKDSKNNITNKEYTTIVNLEDYKYITFSLLTYDLKNIKDNTELKTVDHYWVLQVETSKVYFEVEDYSANKEYYALFRIHDIYGNFSYSDLMKLK